jgi:hypothetical protein
MFLLNGPHTPNTGGGQSSSGSDDDSDSGNAT